jgi:hypothetical protein
LQVQQQVLEQIQPLVLRVLQLQQVLRVQPLLVEQIQ